MAFNLGSEQARYLVRFSSSSLEAFDPATVALQQHSEEKHWSVEESYCAHTLQVFELQSREASSNCFLLLVFCLKEARLSYFIL